MQQQIIKNKTEDFLKNMSEIHSDFAGIDMKYMDDTFYIFLWFLHSGIIIQNRKNKDAVIVHTANLSESIKDKEDILIEKTYKFIKTTEEESGFPLYYLKADRHGKFTVKFKNTAPIPHNISDIFSDIQREIEKNGETIILKGILYETNGNAEIEIQRYEKNGEFYEPEIIDTDLVNTELKEYLNSNFNGYDGVAVYDSPWKLCLVNYFKKDIG